LLARCDSRSLRIGISRAIQQDERYPAPNSQIAEKLAVRAFYESSVHQRRLTDREQTIRAKSYGR